MKSICFLFFVLFSVVSLSAFEEVGVASWYGGHFHGRKTANGEIFNTNEISAAHRELPFGTVVEVINLDNGRTLKVRINDRGPYMKDRIIDLSFAAAQALDMVQSGTANVRILADANVKDAIKYAVIQVGAFKSAHYAKNLKETLVNAGFMPYVTMTSSGIIRIEIKNVLKTEAEAMMNQLRALGIEKPLLKI
jgi:rare lipoprotein A